MFIAKDLKNIDVLAEKSIVGSDYYYPACRERVFLRCWSGNGRFFRTHFAHYPTHPCTDTWHSDYDISDWHYNWQMEFPVANQEVPLHLGDITHRADVIVGRTVVEFQHSKMSNRKFMERNRFYTDLGYKIVWLFDLSEQYENGALKECDTNSFVWDRPFNAFAHYSLVCGQNELFFQLWNSDTDVCIVKVDEISYEGIKQFTISKKYTKEQFLTYLGKNNGTFPKPIELIETEHEYTEFAKKYNITLDAQQERAVQSVNGATLLLAVPGSGKTTVLIARLGYMIFCKGIAPSNILALTYTTDATKEMSERFAAKFDCDASNKVEFRTINGICQIIINYYIKVNKRTDPFKLIESEAERHKIIKAAIEKFNNKAVTKVDIVNVEKAIQYIKNTMLTSKEEIENIPSGYENIYEIYTEYQKMLKDIKGMDYDDQMVYALEILKKHWNVMRHFQKQYQYICVDEAQDTSKLQHQIIKKLAEKHNNIFMVGDEDQSIYQFRGAYPRALLEFKNTYPNPYILFLENNYRSTPEIVECASKFIKLNHGRYDKKINAIRKNGKDVWRFPIQQRYTQYNYLKKVAQHLNGSTAVIYRDNECAIPLINFFLKENIPFKTSSLRPVFFDHKDIHFIKQLYAFAKDQGNTDAFMDICEQFVGIPKQTAKTICKMAAEASISITEAIYRYNKIAGFDKQKALQLKEYIENLCQMDAKTTLPKILDASGMDFDAKNIQILRTISYTEKTFEDFVLRLDELKHLFASNKTIGEDGIVLTTVHAAKGREYDDVYLIDVMDGIFPRHEEDYYIQNGDFELFQEERRILYVALTRAKNRLVIFDNSSENSTFIKELSPCLRVYPQR